MSYVRCFFDPVSDICTNCSWFDGGEWGSKHGGFQCVPSTAAKGWYLLPPDFDPRGWTAEDLLPYALKDTPEWLRSRS